jgi:hypothetical protein
MRNSMPGALVSINPWTTSMGVWDELAADHNHGSMAFGTSIITGYGHGRADWQSHR